MPCLYDGLFKGNVEVNRFEIIGFIGPYERIRKIIEPTCSSMTVCNPACKFCKTFKYAHVNGHVHRLIQLAIVIKN